MEKDDNIKFYKKDDEYGYFSNFYQSPFKDGEITYSTNQHYFQSKKFEGKQYQMTVATAKTPFESFELGRSKEYPIREDWQDVKEKVMYQGLKLKFSQNPELKQKLMDTKQRKLIEHTKKDKYWGDGGDGTGKNRLGGLLMDLRKQFQSN